MDSDTDGKSINEIANSHPHLTSMRNTLTTLTAHPSEKVRKQAVVILSGDATGFEPLHDLLEEGGFMSSIKVGDNYLIQTVTFYYVGKVKSVNFAEIVLSEASCVFDTGRLHDCLRDGAFNEVEPLLDDIVIQMGSVGASTKWRHKLPKGQK